MHDDDTAVLLLERAAALAVQASVARAAHLRAVAGFVARSCADLGPVPRDAHGLEAMDRADAQHGVVAELAARLVITELAAYRLVALAMALTTRLPVTCAAFAEGRIDEERAAVVAHETELLSDAHAAVVDEAIAGALGPLDRAGLRPLVKREVEGVDREAVKRRARRATADRHVRFKALGNGMAELTINAPATALVPAYNNIEALAKDKDRPGGRVDPFASLVHDGGAPTGPDGSPLDRRSAGAHRADVAIDLLTQGLGESAPSGCGPQIFVTFPAATGADDRPAVLDRCGDVPAMFAQHLLGDHGFRRALTDPATGHLVGVESRSHPAGTLSDLVPAVSDPTGAPPDLEAASSDPTGDRHDPTDHPDTCLRAGGVTTRAAAAGDDSSSPAARRLVATTVAPPGARARRSSTTASPAGATSAIGIPSASTTSAVRAPDGPPTGTCATPSTPSSTPANPDAAVPGAGCPVAAAGGGRYEPGAAVLRFVRARSPRCTAPRCRRPSTQCDVDHRVPWPQGPTCPCNLAPLCRRHHLAKHRFGWGVRKAGPDPADPSQHWTSPLGYEYVVLAEPLLPASAAAALARERQVPTETWGGDSVDRARPYRRGRPDWLSTSNTGQAQLALQRHADVHDPPPESVPQPELRPQRPASPGPGWRASHGDDPPF